MSRRRRLRRSAAAPRRRPRSPARLPDADQAEGPVAAAVHDGDDDVRGRRPLARPGPPHLPRRRPLGRRRRRDQPRRRPRHRPHDGPHRRPPGRLRPRSPPRAAIAFGALLERASFLLLATDRQPAGGGALALRLPRLRLRLHALAEAHDAAEHRHRRRRRRGAAAGRLGGRHRRPQRHGLLPLRDRLLLDPAPLLGALAADEGRVREGRRSRCCRSSAARTRPGARSSSTRSSSTPSPSCPSAPAASASPTWSPSMLLGAAFIYFAVRLLRSRRPPLGAAHLPLLARLPGAALPLDGDRRHV